MASIEKIKTDVKLEADGKWVDYTLGIRLRIARAGNPAYLEAMRRLTEPMRQEIREKKLTIEDFTEILLKVRAETILLNWENIEDKDGATIPHSPAKVEEFFRDEELKDFYKFVVDVSENSAEYVKQVIEESEKN